MPFSWFLQHFQIPLPRYLHQDYEIRQLNFDGKFNLLSLLDAEIMLKVKKIKGIM